MCDARHLLVPLVKLVVDAFWGPISADVMLRLMICIDFVRFHASGLFVT
jgi:hypothetical protein